MDCSWDERKAASNLRKHHVSFDEAATVFADSLALAVEDALEPERTLLVGISCRQRAATRCLRRAGRVDHPDHQRPAGHVARAEAI
jgi:uncharacterized DUF497 family protein